MTIDKKTWTYESCEVDGRAVHRVVDSEGTHIGNYVDAAGAAMVIRLHNQHETRSAAMHELDAMYASGIHFTIEGDNEYGIRWVLPDLFLAGPWSGSAPTIEEVLIDLTNAARRGYPSSCFTRGRPSDIVLVEDQRTLETLSYELGSIDPFSLEFDPTDTVSPDAAPWTVRMESGEAFAAYTAEDGLRFALESLTPSSPQ